MVAFDIGIGVLSRAKRWMPGLRCVIADGAATLFRDGCPDLLCFARSWHWLDERPGMVSFAGAVAGESWLSSNHESIDGPRERFA